MGKLSNEQMQGYHLQLKQLTQFKNTTPHEQSTNTISTNTISTNTISTNTISTNTISTNIISVKDVKKNAERIKYIQKDIPKINKEIEKTNKNNKTNKINGDIERTNKDIEKTNGDIEIKNKKIRVEFYQKMLGDDKLIREEQFKFLIELHKIPEINRLNYLYNLGVVKEFNAEHNYSKKVVLLEGFIVKKMIDHTSFGNFVFWNEVKSLRKLLQYKHFPKLIAYDSYNLIIYMSYCGNMINSSNLPSNWLEQMTEIKNELVKADVNSNDMLVRNTCVLDNRIYIIDFGLDTIFRKNIDTTVSKLVGQLSLLATKQNNNGHVKNKKI